MCWELPDVHGRRADRTLRKERALYTFGANRKPRKKEPQRTEPADFFIERSQLVILRKPAI
jgi:hypothetical protein